MATLGNKRKLAAVSRETPEDSSSGRGQYVLDPELTQDYTSQVSEEIQGRVTKKLCKEFSKTESRILGALSKLDEFLLNPQVRTCSVAIPGTARNTNSENRETTEDRSSDDPHPEVGYFPHYSGQLNSPETENNPHRIQYFPFEKNFSTENNNSTNKSSYDRSGTFEKKEGTIAISRTSSENFTATFSKEACLSEICNSLLLRCKI